MKQLETIVFGGGCFWCVEAVFQNLKGVVSVFSGYAGGTMDHPSYEEVSSGVGGHAEVINIAFDPAIISFTDLLSVFFSTHDPTTLNRQGADRGEQYRSVIFYTTEEQKREAEAYIEKLTREHIFSKPIVTELKPLNTFFKAEEYHQRYYEKNPDKPYCNVVINPKLKKLREQYAHLLK